MSFQSKGPKARKKIAQGKRSAALGKMSKRNLSPAKGETLLSHRIPLGCPSRAFKKFVGLRPYSCRFLFRPFQGLDLFWFLTQGGAALALGYHLSGFQPCADSAVRAPGFLQK